MKRNSDYIRGCRAEAQIKRTLQRTFQSKGWRVEDSTIDEDIGQDIDCWIVKPDGRTPVSIKSQPIANKTGFIYLEMEVKMVVGVKDEHDRLNPDAYDYEWQPSWGQYSKAEVYVVDLGKAGTLVIRKDQLAEALEDKRVKHRHIKGNKPETVRKQMEMGHPHHDARGLIVNWEDLLTRGYACLLECITVDYSYQPVGLI